MKSAKSSRDRKREHAAESASSTSDTSTSSAASKKRSRTTRDSEAVDDGGTSGPSGNLLSFLNAATDPEISEPSPQLISRVIGAIKQCPPTKSGANTAASYENCLLASRDYPTCFRQREVTDHLLEMIRSSNSLDHKKLLGPTACANAAVFAVNLLMNAYQDVDAWPLSFVEVWMEDASTNRYWVDQTYCAVFIENLRASFGTKTSPSNLLLHDSSSSSAVPLRKDLDSEELKNALGKLDEMSDPPMATSRFTGQEAEVGSIIINFANEVIENKTSEVSKNLLRALTLACGLTSVRVLVVAHLEQWLHNPKCTRQAQQLLLSLCVNAHCNNNADAEVVVEISKLKIKSKQMSQFFSTAVREMVKDDDNNMRNVISQIVYNELSISRNPNNLMVLGTIIPASPEAFGMLAEVIIELLQKKDDFLPAIRLILREIQRASRFECSLIPFVETLLKAKDIAWRDADIRERAFKSVTDLVLLSMFLSCPPGIRDDRDSTILTNFLNTVSKIQEEALRWLYQFAGKVFQPSKRDYILAFNKLVLKDPGTDLQSKDGFPNESERALFGKLCLRTPLSETALMWLLFNSLNSTTSKEQNLTMQELLDYAEYFIMKGAAANCLLPMQKLEIIELLFRLCQYRHPENIILPVGYEPPKLAITKSYWRVWLLLCVISSNNPSTLGKVAFESYPTLKALMEMCMTNHFAFPTPSSLSMEEIMAKERQLAAREKELILEFEGHLAAASSKNLITEKNSLLLSQLMSLDPLGPCRCPPQSVLSHLQSLNERLRLGHNLCRSRNPDFLVDLIQRNSQPILNRLSELVSEGSFEALPVQCLCEFLLQAHRLKKLIMADNGQALRGADSSEKGVKKISKIADAAKEDMKAVQLVYFLRDILHGTAAETVKEVLEYFCIRLYSPKAHNRAQALQALELLFWSPQNASDNWLIDGLPNIRMFSEVQEMIIVILRKALAVENDPDWICRYIEYLGTWGFLLDDPEIVKIVYDVAQFVVERNCVASLVLSMHHEVFEPLFNIFSGFLRKAQEPNSEICKWFEDQETENVLLKWEGEKEEAVISTSVIQAILILLSSYESKSDKSVKKESQKLERKHKELGDAWFGSSSQDVSYPQGFLVAPFEGEACIYPDWIKLRMIRSNHSRLLRAALMDAKVEHLLLFVQSFGIPPACVTALLSRLEALVAADPKSVKKSITDAGYMKTLVEMHYARGAKGGEEFYRLLKAQANVDAESAGQLPGSSTPQVRSTLAAKRRAVPTYTGRRASNYCCKVTQSGPTNNEGMELHTIITHLMAMSGLQPVGSNPRNSLGHLVDTFLQVEPSAVRRAQDVQLSLLLGRNKPQPLWRPLLLTVLIHESNWATVQECIQTCLTTFNPSVYDSGAVLDLLAATITNPKLWQGRDKATSKHQDDSLALKLDRNQISALALYIMDEVSQFEGKNNSNSFSISNILCSPDPTSQPSPSKQALCTHDRVKLWIKCCLANEVSVSEALNSIFRIRCSGWGLLKFLSEVYYEQPEVITKIDFPEYIEKLPEGPSASITDNITHSLIYAVANVQGTKEFKKLATEIDQCLRKLASTHPFLIARQLDLMKALLEGRIHLEFSTFHAQNHHIPFQIYLGLLELIQPCLVNKAEKMQTLKSILELYIKVFHNYAHQKDYGTSLGRFATFIQNLLKTNQAGIRELLATYYATFKELAQCQFYEELDPLHNLMNSLVPPKSGSELSVLTSENSDAYLQSAAVDIVHQNTTNVDELVPVMQELDYVSTRHPATLQPFTHLSAPLVRSDNDACRSLAFALILKHMTNSPEACNSYLEPVLKAWTTKDGFCNNNLLRRFNEFIVLSQETGEWLFKELFNVGVTTSNSQAQAAMMRTIEFLRAHRTQI